MESPIRRTHRIQIRVTISASAAVIKQTREQDPFAFAVISVDRPSEGSLIHTGQLAVAIDTQNERGREREPDIQLAD